jgi:transposase
VVLEASTGSFRLYDELVTHVREITVAHPYQTRGAGALHAKTDRRDAIVLARLRKAGFIQGVWVPGSGVRALRGLTEFRHTLSQLRQGATSRIKSLLAQEMITPPMTCLSGPRGQKYLNKLTMNEESLNVYLRSQVSLFTSFDEQVQKVDEQLKAWCATSEDAQLLLTIPGVGPVVASCLLSQIGDATRFATPSKLCAYAGLVPRVHQSGTTLKLGRISRAGRPLMRWALGMAVIHVAHRPGALKDFCSRLGTRRPKAVVHVACARKLLAVIWHMLTRREVYAAQDEALSARKRESLAKSLTPPSSSARGKGKRSRT